MTDPVSALSPTNVEIWLRQQMQGAKHLWDLHAWARRGYTGPPPRTAKFATLLRYGLWDCTWIETGTYCGDTAAWLARRATRVITIEPQPALARYAQRRLLRLPHVEVLNRSSEEALPLILPLLRGAVCFWLDAHYSGGVTANLGVPLASELELIAAHATRFDDCVVFVDDFECFTPEGTRLGYPPLSTLIEFATASELEMTVSNNIFVAGRNLNARLAGAAS